MIVRHIEGTSIYTVICYSRTSREISSCCESVGCEYDVENTGHCLKYPCLTGVGMVGNLSVVNLAAQHKSAMP
jgi:hypothetical protein